jgi:hypothetical protein
VKNASSFFDLYPVYYHFELLTGALEVGLQGERIVAVVPYGAVAGSVLSVVDLVVGYVKILAVSSLLGIKAKAASSEGELEEGDHIIVAIHKEVINHGVVF